MLFWLFLFIFIAFVIWFFLLRKNKFIKVGSLSLITGGVKAGKSTVSVAKVCSEYKGALFGYYIDYILCKIFFKPLPEKPLIYSNVPLNVKWGYVPLTEDLILRKKRFRYRSVIYVNEASLLHDKDIYRNVDKSTQISLFNKLIGHSTHGGCVIYDTQCIGDLPVVVRRCLNTYFYVHHMVKWIPFVILAYVREERYSEDGTSVNVNTGDVENELKRVFMWKSTWKKFDCYCFSKFTDNLPVVDNVIKKPDTLKVDKLVTFQSIYNRFLNNKEIKTDEKK